MHGLGSTLCLPLTYQHTDVAFLRRKRRKEREKEKESERERERERKRE
jgi:hypothetical protein